MNYYFIGIGGIGMSALARYFKQRGDTVSGYDRTPSPLTAELAAEGIDVHYDDAPGQLPTGIDLAVYTPAVPNDLAELQTLRQRGVRLAKRSQVLGELTVGKRCIAVAGSHGKTTTTALIAHLLNHAGIGCTALLGGISKNFGSNLLVNEQSDYIVVEADEYDRSFLQLHPLHTVITATDPDHLDIYGTHEQMMDAYMQFASQTSPEGTLLIKQGSFHRHDGTPYITYGSAPASTIAHIYHPHLFSYTTAGAGTDYFATNVHTIDGDLLFDLHTPNIILNGLRLRGTALFNIENAVAASAIALRCGLNGDQLRDGLLSFEGVRRRFDYRIRERQLVFIDDYAHHPKEIQSTIESVRFLYPGKRVVGIFQPHLYSRTRDLADDFARVLGTLDELVLLPIYPAREKPIPGITSEMLLNKVRMAGKHLCTPEQALEAVPAMHPDVVLTLGAGDIDRLVPQLETKLREKTL